MGRHRLVTATLALFVLVNLPAPISGGLAPAAAVGDSVQDRLVAALSAELDRTALPAEPEACGVTIHHPGAEVVDTTCPTTTAGPEAAAESQTAIEELAALETPRWWTQLATQKRPGGDAVVRVHGYGEVAVMDAAGETLWRRPSRSFFSDWGLEPWIVPVVLLGTAPADPFAWASERAFAVGDLTGDGIDEIVVAHLVWEGAPDHVARSMVTVLDGTSGTTLWTRTYSGAVTQVVLAGTTLVVGEETGQRTIRVFGPIGEDGASSRLHALAFDHRPSGLVAEDRWTLSTERSWARWLALEPAGEHRVAAAWTAKPVGAAGETGRVVMLDVDSGQPAWQQATDGYPRMLRHDLGRATLVVAEQADLRRAPAPATSDFVFAYSLAALDIADGSERLRVQREDGLLLSLALGDVTGDGAAEWLTGDLEWDDQPLNAVAGLTPPAIADTVEAGRIVVSDGGDGQERWRHRSTPEDPGGLLMTYGVHAAGGLVVAGSFAADAADLRAFDGVGGQMRWQDSGEAPFPLSIVHTNAGGEAVLITMTERLAVRTLATDSGELRVHTPLLADVHATAAADVTGDGAHELLLGTHSGAVFTVDPVTLGDELAVRWRADIGDPVRMLATGDVTGDGKLEVVVAATSAVHVLRGADGTAVYSIPYPDEFVWTVALGDLTGDGVADIVVPTRTLAGHSGPDGETLWRHDPIGTEPPLPDVEEHVVAYFGTAIVADGRAVAPFLVHPPANLAARHHHFAVAVDGASGEVAWQQAHVRPIDITRLWRSVALLPGQGRDGGDAVGFAYDARTYVPAGWRPAALVYDLASGDLLWQSGPVPAGTVHEQVVVRNGDFLQLTWHALARFRPGAADVVSTDASAFAVAFADSGTAGEFMLAAYPHVRVYEPEVDWTVPDGRLQPLASWNRLHADELLVADLDGDGTDTVITFKLDDVARSRVNGWEGTSRFGGSLFPFGVAILQITGS